MKQAQCDEMINPFSNPDYYRRLMLKHDLVTYNKQEYSSKSFMCVFFTRFCGVGCPFCFFKSAPARNEITVADQINEEGINRFIEFCNQANLGYVLVSGGGEPLTQKRAVLRTIAEVETQRIVLVRSEEHTSELQSQSNLVCRLLLEKK